MTTVLILGGLGQDGPRQLLPFLLSSAGPSPAFVRVVDKYLIIPAADAYTTYIDADARAALKSPLVEYVQGNLLTEGELAEVRAVAGASLLATCLRTSVQVRVEPQWQQRILLRNRTWSGGFVFLRAVS